MVLSETMSDLVKRETSKSSIRLYYKKFSDVPFSGKITGRYQGKIKNGKEEGAWFTYFKNGQLRSKSNYKNGEREGAWVAFNIRGDLYTRGNYKNGKKEGAWFYFKENGERNDKLSGTYKNGKKISY